MQNCETSKDREQNYIQVHDTLPTFPSFRDVARPNHFLMRAWPFAVFARKSFLQAFRQKRRPQWLWWTRPNFPPQFAQRFANLVMKLSTDLQVDGTTRQTRAIVCAWLVYALRTRRVQDLPETRSDYVVTAVPTGLLSAANSLLFWANGLQSAAVQSRRSWKWSDA